MRRPAFDANAIAFCLGVSSGIVRVVATQLGGGGVVGGVGLSSWIYS